MKIVNTARRPSDSLHRVTPDPIKNSVNLYGSIQEAWNKHNNPEFFVRHLNDVWFFNKEELYYFIMVDIADLALDYICDNFCTSGAVVFLKEAKIILHDSLVKALLRIEEAQRYESNALPYNLISELYRLVHFYIMYEKRYILSWYIPTCSLYRRIGNKEICDVFRKHVPEFPALNELHYY